MRKYIIIALILLVALPSLAKEGGNGQLLVKVNEQWVPVEVALSRDTRMYRGLYMLPGISKVPETNPTFNKKYGEYMVDWLNIVKSYAPDLAASLIKAATITDFVFVNGEIVFLAKDYPRFPVEYKEFKKAALFYAGKVYISIPNMELMKHFEGISKEDQQGLVMVHEVINAKYSKSLTTLQRIRMGQFILEIKTRKFSQTQYLAENIFEKFDVFGALLSTDAKIELIKYLDSLGRLNDFDFSLEDIKIMKIYEEIRTLNPGEELPVTNSEDLIEWAHIFSRKELLGFPDIGSKHLTVERLKKLIEEDVLTDLKETVLACPEPIKSRLKEAIQLIWNGYIAEPSFEQLRQVPLSWLNKAFLHEYPQRLEKMIEYSYFLVGNADQWSIPNLYNFLFSISDDYEARRADSNFLEEMMSDLRRRIDMACLAQAGRSCLVENQYDFEVIVINRLWQYTYNGYRDLMPFYNNSERSFLALEDVLYNGDVVVTAGQIIRVSTRANKIKVKVEVSYNKNGKAKTKTIPTLHLFKKEHLEKRSEWFGLPDMRGMNIMLAK